MVAATAVLRGSGVDAYVQRGVLDDVRRRGPHAAPGRRAGYGRPPYRGVMYSPGGHADRYDRAALKLLEEIQPFGEWRQILSALPYILEGGKLVAITAGVYVSQGRSADLRHSLVKSLRSLSAEEADWLCGLIAEPDGQRATVLRADDLDDVVSLDPSVYLRRERLRDASLEMFPLDGLMLSSFRGPVLPKGEGTDGEMDCYLVFLQNLGAHGVLEGEMAPVTDASGVGEGSYLQPGDIVVSRTLPLKSALVRHEDIVAPGADPIRLVPTSNAYVLRPDESKVLPAYLELFLLSPLRRLRFDALGTGESRIRTYSRDAFSQVEVPVTPLKEQQVAGRKWNELQMERRELLEFEARLDRDLKAEFNELMFDLHEAGGSSQEKAHRG